MSGKITALVSKCISDKTFIIAAVILAVVLIIVIISLAVKEKNPCLICAHCFICPDLWIKYNRKCLYVSKEERNWSMSLNICSSFNASLAVIDTQKELDFFVDNFGHLPFWFGLSRKDNQIWKWPNGTEFTNQFPVEREGFCAYVNRKGASSTICSVEKRFICSYPESCPKLDR